MLPIDLFWHYGVYVHILGVLLLGAILLKCPIQLKQVCYKFQHLKVITFVLAVSLSDVHALREDVKQLMELIQKLIIEFKAVKVEVEASHIDIMDSVHLAIALCKSEYSTK